MKMYVVLVLLASMLGTTTASDTCPYPHLCICINEYLSCTCTAREDLTIRAILHFGIRNILIKGCGSIVVSLGSMTHMQLDAIRFVDISHLNIRPFALTGVQTISSLELINIQDLDIASHGFSGLYNLTDIIIRNVTANRLPFGAFGGLSDIENFSIENSNIKYVDSLAFILSNVTNFRIKDTKIGVFENVSIIVHSSYEMLFDNCDIQETNNNTFSIAYVNTLSFESCRIGVFSTTTITSKSLQSFHFNNCTVEEFEADALAFMEVTKSVVFSHNTIEIAGENSLFPSYGPFYPVDDLQIETDSNQFTCDCNIYWIWETNEIGIYDLILNNSLCIGDSTKNLTTIVPILDSSSNCMTLESKQYITTTATTTTNREFEVTSNARFLTSSYVATTLVGLFWYKSQNLYTKLFLQF